LTALSSFSDFGHGRLAFAFCTELVCIHHPEKSQAQHPEITLWLLPAGLGVIFWRPPIVVIGCEVRIELARIVSGQPEVGENEAKSVPCPFPENVIRLHITMDDPMFAVTIS